ncbi:MAG TPA: response regulator [Planctomycetota bacterium]|nr:response regulator [Planctomycetota bacterium]
MEPTRVRDNELSVLVCGDEPGVRESLSGALRADGFEVELASDGRVALDRIREKDYALVLAGVRMAGVSGLDLLRETRKLRPATVVVMITGKSELSDAIESIRQGAYDYLRKPFDSEDVLVVARRSVEKRRLQREATGVAEIPRSGPPI